jgi:hypothetical protein
MVTDNGHIALLSGTRADLATSAAVDDAQSQEKRA